MNRTVSPGASATVTFACSGAATGHLFCCDSATDTYSLPFGAAAAVPVVHFNAAVGAA